MFSFCANPDCQAPFDYRQGRLFRFHKDHPVGEKPPNTHSVQHFWMCGVCCGIYTLEHLAGRGVVIKSHSTAVRERADVLRFITAA
jgi:hypothetical protein